MKTCPLCAEEIQDAAVKCKHCGEHLSVPGRTATSPPPATSRGIDPGGLVFGLLLIVVGIIGFVERTYFASTFLHATIIGDMGLTQLDVDKLKVVATLSGITFFVGFATLAYALRRVTR